MKIACRGGHSLDIRGASGIVDEVNVDRVITAKVIEYLRAVGHEVLDVTPGNSGTSGQDLSIPVSKANAWGAGYFFSLHLNASTGSGYGTEVLYKSPAGKVYADRIVSNLAALGFYYRGSKADTRGLYEFNHCHMPNNIVECFFCDNATDVSLYNQIGIDAIAKAISDAISGKLLSGWMKFNDGHWYCFENGIKVINSWRKDSKDWCYLNEKGQALVKEWAKDSSKRWFYCGPDCRIVRDKWIDWDGKKYYFDKEGAWVEGKTQ